MTSRLIAKSPPVEDEDSESEEFDSSDEEESEPEEKETGRAQEELKDESSEEESEEEQYQAQSDSDDEEEDSQEEKETDPEDELEDELLANLPDEEDDAAGEEDGQEEEILEAEGDEEQVFDEGKRKKPTLRKKGTKRRLFPFLKRKRKSKLNIPFRDPSEYVDLDIRETSKDFLKTLELENREIGTFEKLIYNASVRKVKNLQDMTVDSPAFKGTYLEILGYFVGNFSLLDKATLIAELKTDNYGWNSKTYAGLIAVETRELDKIRNPTEASDYPDNPCGRCGGTKLFMYKKQLRGGDEGMSALFWCQAKGCGYRWRVNG